MPDNFYRPLVKILKRNGVLFVRNGKGDHEIWESPINGVKLPVPSKCPSRHTANAALKQAGIKEKL
ncbi:MAG: type II toxin-antitoxin system HicA family toxin [Emcibacter sp.]|nr:type II toxin-antitoxin system HicA family toxin [Emcibacter sp.]